MTVAHSEDSAESSDRPRQSGPVPRRIVYTALIGGYESSISQPVSRTTETRFVCFTDRPDAIDPTWETVTVSPKFPTDLVRSARYLKTVGHQYLDDFEEVLWIDNRVQLRKEPSGLFEWLAGDCMVAAPHHSFRNEWRDEFNALLRFGYDEPSRIRSQFAAYKSTENLGARPFWTGMLVRRWNDSVKARNRLWWENLLLYSRRDQLSFPYVFNLDDGFTRQIRLDNLQSEFHLWVQVSKIGRDMQRSQSARTWTPQHWQQAWDLFRATLVGRKIAALLYERDASPFRLR